jgi:hypothetical protein
MVPSGRCGDPCPATVVEFVVLDRHVDSTRGSDALVELSPSRSVWSSVRLVRKRFEPGVRLGG